MSLSLKVRNGELIDFTCPKVMGILNVTPDSFYAPSRKQSEESIRQRVDEITRGGATFIDVGAYSTRPGAELISAEEEMSRLRFALPIIREANVKNLILSVDTFRGDVARMCVEEYGVDSINDISGGEFDPTLFPTLSRLHVPYVLSHIKGDIHTMHQETTYSNIVREMFFYFSTKIKMLHDLGVCDIILDPGFGFSKLYYHNYEVMGHLQDFKEFQLPILVGISRKSMITKLLHIPTEETLNATTALNAIALTKGADIIRVHDVQQANEAVTLYHFTNLAKFR